MSDSQEQPWSDNPNAPEIPYVVYLLEKSLFAGALISSILYGVLIVLFSKCMIALFIPVNRRGEGIKWGLVSYTVVMFLSVTVHTAINGHILSISYIDNRDFPDDGPYGYRQNISSTVIVVIPRAAFRLNNWAADGLLLYRCYLFYSMNLWFVALPFLMYLGSVAIGILAMCPTQEWVSINFWSSLAYISISLSLNVLLTLMIVVRLVLRSKNVRAAMGSPAGISGLYKSIATMLIESSALFAMGSLLVLITWAIQNPITNVFTSVLAQIQVIASLLIVQRVANKSALTSDTISPGSSSPFKASSQGGSAAASGALPGGHPVGSVGERWASVTELGIGDGTAIDICREKV